MSQNASGSIAIALAGCILAAVAGCSSTPEPELAAAQPGYGPANTGAYPNLNIRPGVAAPQFSDAERDAKLAELEAKRRRQGGR